MCFIEAQLSAFLKKLIDDTENNRIFWNQVGSWGSEYHSIDFRSINPILFSISDKEPFIYNNWDDVYISNIMTSFVYVAKVKNTPPLYRIFIQPDADSKLFTVNLKSNDTKKLYDLVSSQFIASQSSHPISDFVYDYLTKFTPEDD